MFEKVEVVGRGGGLATLLPQHHSVKSSKMTNYCMKQKNIFYTYGCISTLPYIKGGKKGQKL